MTDRDVLSQEEIDALLSGVDNGAVDVDVAADSDSSDVRSYDLTSQSQISRGRLPTLELLGEKFARALRADMQSLLRFTVEVGAGGVQILNYAEYAGTLYIPTSITIAKVAPLAGHSLVVIDAKLVSRMVDQYFGGDGTNITVEGRDFSPTEQRVVERVLECIYRNMAAAWAELLPISIETVGGEINPALLNLYGPEQVLLVNTFHVQLESGGGEIHFAIPYDAIEPYRELLDAAGRGDDEAPKEDWTPQLQALLLDAEVPLRCSVASAQLKLRDLIRMQVGDVIDVDMPELHVVSAADVPAFMAKLGESRGHLALEFHQHASERHSNHG